jgi:hypothetical protein
LEQLVEAIQMIKKVPVLMIFAVLAKGTALWGPEIKGCCQRYYWLK